MALITWKNPVNGDWSDAADWSTDTVPTSADDVTISALGIYTVTISNNAFANSLTFNGSLTELVQNAGSLSLPEGLNVDAATVSLNGANAIGGVNVADDGIVEFGDSGALGSGPVSLTGPTARDCKRNSHQRALNFGNFGNRRRGWNDVGRKRDHLHHQR